MRLLLVAPQRLGLLQLLLDGAERLVDHRRQLRLHVVDLLLLAHRQVVLARHAHLDHDAVAIALLVRALLARERHVATGDLGGELFEVAEPLGDELLDPGTALDVLENYFRRYLHRSS